MKRRGALAAAFVVAAAPARALVPCAPGTRPAVLAEIRFTTRLPDGTEVTEAQWRTFRSDIVDPVLRLPPGFGETVARDGLSRSFTVEVQAPFNPGAPPDPPPRVHAVMRGWQARFPAFPVDVELRPACLRPRPAPR
jgi:hypothetical protein